MVKFPYKFPALPDKEVRVKVTYAGLCHSDVHTVHGHWGPAQYPIAPGHEIVGIVTEVGKTVTKHKVGDKVAIGAQRACCNTCKICVDQKDESYCSTVAPKEKFTYGYYWGGYQTHVQHPEQFVFALPEGIPENVAAPLMCAGITVFSPIKRYTKPGMKCAVFGIGGLGHLAVQYLVKMGLDVTAITSSNDKHDYIMSLGANRVCNFNDEEDLKKYANTLDFIINTASGGIDFDKLSGLMAVGCYISQVSAPPGDQPAKISSMIIMKKVTIGGSLLGSVEETEEMLKFSAEKKVFPLCEQFLFSEMDKAFDRLVNGKPIFRCVVNVEDYSKTNNIFK
jgi:uncharacterized zinc-type alcohol dehydrogenase-like protein